MPKQPQVLAPGEGIGSVDVGIRKKPGGQLSGNFKHTGPDGNVIFKLPPPGSYGVVITPGDAAKSFDESRSNIWRATVVLEGIKGGRKTHPLIADFKLTKEGKLIKIVPSGAPPVPHGEENEIAIDVTEGQSVFVNMSIKEQGTPGQPGKPDKPKKD